MGLIDRLRKKPEPAPAPRKRRKKRLPKTLHPGEAQALLRALPVDEDGWRGDQAVRDRAMVYLMWRAGLRVGEVVSLSVDDVEGGTIRIWDGKGGDGTAYPDDETMAAVRAWLSIRHRYKTGHSALLFVTVRRPSGQPVTIRYVQRLAKRMADAAGVDAHRVTPHKFRHTFATDMLREGFNLREVQTALRHADVGTTQVYAAVLDEDLRRKMSTRRSTNEETP